MILVLIVLQVLLFQRVKVKEYHLLLHVDAALEKHRQYDADDNALPMELSTMRQVGEEIVKHGGTVEDLDSSYILIFVIDCVLVFQFILMNYQRTQMEKATGEFERRGLHLPESKHQESMR